MFREGTRLWQKRFRFRSGILILVGRRVAIARTYPEGEVFAIVGRSKSDAVEDVEGQIRVMSEGRIWIEIECYFGKNVSNLPFKSCTRSILV